MTDSPNATEVKVHQFYLISTTALSIICGRTKSSSQINFEMKQNYPAMCDSYLKDFPDQIPKWLTKNRLLAKHFGKDESFNGLDLWRKWEEGEREIVNKWNPEYNKFIVNGIPPSGKSVKDVIVMRYQEISICI